MEKKIRSKVITLEEAVEIGEEYRRPEVELLRSMIFEEGKRAIRRRVLENLPASTLEKSLKLKKVKNKLMWARLFMKQHQILYPDPPLKVDPRKIDITLWLKLAQVFSSGGFSNDEFEEAANKLRDLRNAITHIGDITKFEMDASWDEAEDLLLKLGATRRSIDKYKDQRRQALDLYTPDDSQSMHMHELKTDVDQGSVKFMTRAGWKANKPTGKRDLIVDRMPVNYLIVSQLVCSRASGRDGDMCQVISNIQRFHMKNKGWFDIAYNFLVGDDVVIYEGREWDFQGATAFGWNEKSFGVCFVGPKTRPSRKAERAFLTFINYLVSVNKLSEDSIVHGLSQVRPAIHNMPAERFYRRMRDWPRWKICQT